MTGHPEATPFGRDRVRIKPTNKTLFVSAAPSGRINPVTVAPHVDDSGDGELLRRKPISRVLGDLVAQPDANAPDLVKLADR